MNPHIRKYHIIIVHYGNLQSTQRLVTALLQCKKSPDTIIVVNHNNKLLPKSSFQGCHVINPAGNQGYAAGINTGLGALMARGASANDIITCINNDITIQPKAFLLLRRWWKNNPEPALVGFATAQNKHKHTYGYINLFTGRAHLSSSSETNIKTTALQMRYIHGAFMSAPFELFIGNHGISEKYFMYWEDALFSNQVEKRKFPLKTVPATIGTHQPMNTDKSISDDKLYYLVRNGALFLEQETSLLWHLYWLIINRLRYLYHILKRPQKTVVVEALKDAIYGVTGPRLK